MTLPNFLIIGAAKGGTTSLYAYLQQHPQVFMSSPKEPTFFGNEGTDGLFNGPHDEDRGYHSRVITNFVDYSALFDRVTNEKAIGEASIYYVYLPEAPEQIRKYVPKAAMFAILRNPADRAYSAYLHVVRQAREPYPAEVESALAFQDYGFLLSAGEALLRHIWARPGAHLLVRRLPEGTVAADQASFRNSGS